MKRILGIVSIATCLTFPMFGMRPNVAQGLNNLKNSLDVLTRSLKAPSVKPQEVPVTKPKGPQPEIKPFATHGLIILLDDSESEGTAHSEFGAMSDYSLQALVEEVTPIVCSASLIVNLRGADKAPTEKNSAKLVKIFNEMREGDPEKLTEEERKEEKRIILSVWSFNVNTAKRWIIKEINSSLYLLIPRSYLKARGINDRDVELFNSRGSITQTEQKLGLKVNHMKTVKVTDVKKPMPAPEFADYFIGALPAIFVTNAEYPANNKAGIPTWALWIEGHGGINHSIADLSFARFKEFLAFLENTITTKLLFYISCYAAGVNAELVYKDLESGVDKTYPFAIITEALTDAPTEARTLRLKLEKGKPVVQVRENYRNFFSKVASSDVINYTELRPFVATMQKVKESALSNLAQIKFPGLPWFSVLDSDKVVSIGSILGKARTKPLDIATFFAKKGKEAEPLGILLYAKNIPFELIIDIKNIPAIVSMIPGNAFHNIRKISSTTNTIEDVLNSFLTIDDLAPRKIFIIDEVPGRFSKFMNDTFKESKGTLLNVIIDLTEAENNIYFTYKNNVYRMGTKKEWVANKLTLEHSLGVADEVDQQKYKSFLAKYKKGVPVSLDEIKAEGAKLFAQTLGDEKIAKAIADFLDMMPDHTIIRLPKVMCDGDCLVSIYGLVLYRSVDDHKIVWFQEAEIFYESEKTVVIDSQVVKREIVRLSIIYKDLIVDVTREDGAQVFYEDSQGKNPKGLDKFSYNDLTEDYVPAYEKMLNYFEKNKTLDETLEQDIEDIETRSVHQLVTPESLAKLKAALAKGAVKRKTQQKR
jgi:hypothetical protein